MMLQENAASGNVYRKVTVDVAGILGRRSRKQVYNGQGHMFTWSFLVSFHFSFLAS